MFTTPLGPLLLPTIQYKQFLLNEDYCLLGHVAVLAGSNLTSQTTTL